jgi:four helix bundle suffix protein
MAVERSFDMRRCCASSAQPSNSNKQRGPIRAGPYEDCLRTNRVAAWSKDSKEGQYVRRLGSNPALKFDDIREFAETRPGPVVANIALCLVHQANYLLDQQLRQLEQAFLKEGGLRERMTRARLESRARREK